MIEIREIESVADLRRVARLRYTVYVEELGITVSDDIHQQRAVVDPFDADGHVLAAWKNGQLVGTLRTNFSGESDLSRLPVCFDIENIYAQHPDSILAFTSRMAVLSSARSHTLFVRLASAAFELGFGYGITHDMISSWKNVEPLYRRLGYQVINPKTIHPESGEVSILLLSLHDHQHLEQCRSPLLTTLNRLESNQAEEHLQTGESTPN